MGAFLRTEFLCISVLRVASGPRVKLASCKSVLNPPVVCSTDRSKAVPLNTGMDFFFYEMDEMEIFFTKWSIFCPFLPLLFCFHDFYHI